MGNDPIIGIEAYPVRGDRCKNRI
ncbi:hypothetical protein ACNKHT_27425 [Shigella flexneri]